MGAEGVTSTESPRLVSVSQAPACPTAEMGMSARTNVFFVAERPAGTAVFVVMVVMVLRAPPQ